MLHNNLDTKKKKAFLFVLNYKSELNFLSQVSQASPSCPVRLLVHNRSSTGLDRWGILCKKHVFHECRQKHNYILSVFPHETNLFEQENLTSAGKKKISSRTFYEKYWRNKTALVFLVSPQAQFCFFFKAALYFILELKSWKTSAHLLHAQLSDAAGKRWLARWLGVYDFTLSELFSPSSLN